MKKYFILVSIWISFMSFCIAQRAIQTDQNEMSLVELAVYDQDIAFTAPVTSEDKLAVQLYKRYFNPSSFEAYKSFFLAADWGGFSKADFDKWQQHIRNNHLVLQKSMRVFDQLGNEFVICQYTLETPQYKIPGTAIFKRINQSWKHISFMNDPLATDLKQIGLLKNSFIEALPEDGNPRSLHNMESNELKPVEKFDRTKLYSEIEGLLISKKVSGLDLELAKKLFLEKAEVEMVQYIGQAYQIDPYDLMEEMNEVIGFSLFKFVRTLKTK